MPYIVGEIEMLHRQYVINVVYTLVGENFQDWVDKQVRIRNKKMAEEKNMNISMDPEIAQIFKNSTTISGRYIFFVISFLLSCSIERNIGSSFEVVSKETSYQGSDQGRIER